MLWAWFFLRLVCVVVLQLKRGEQNCLPTIGLWQPVLTLEKSGFSKVRNPHAIKKHLIKHAEKHLGAKMGDKYQKVVLKCLKGDFEVVDDTKEDLNLQQAFRANVVDLLQRSADSF